MLQKLSATPRRMVAWIAAGVIIILLAALWVFSDRKPSTPKAPDQKLTKTVFRKKITQDHKTANRVVTKKIAAVNSPLKPPATIETQPTPEDGTPTRPPSLIKTEQPEKKKTVEPRPTISATQKKDLLPKAGLQQEAKPAPVIAKPAAREVRREKWLLSQDTASYTIQIIGVANEKSLLDFIKKNQLLKLNEIAYYESTFKGKPWYQLLYGIYPTKQDARLAANKLPENFRPSEPWIRSISAVQKAIGN